MKKLTNEKKKKDTKKSLIHKRTMKGTKYGTHREPMDVARRS